MAAVDPEQARITFLGPDEPWVDNVLSYIKAAGYIVTRAEAVELKQILSNGNQPDVIVHTNHVEHGSIADLCNELESVSKQPLLISITSHASALETTNQFTFPADPAYIVGHISRYLELRRENTDLKQRIEKLMSVQQKTTSEVNLLRDVVVNNVAHELRTPLLQIKAAVSLLSETTESDELLQLAKGATARLEVLVKNITMLNSSIDINIGPAIARDTIHYAIRNLGRVWNQKDAIKRIEFDIEDDLPPVMADKTGLSTVIQLLTDNALKFSNETVIVSARAHQDTIAIAVTDFGTGMSEDQIEKIFEPFYQVDGSSTRAAGGTGIGLALVRLILDKHGTSIYVKSQPGKGSEFCFYLPIANLRSH